MDRLDAPSLGKAGNYFLMTSILVPRPIGWLGTRSAQGVDNLAPFSYFMGVSSEPALVAVSIARGRGGALKDSARNLLDNGQGTLSVVSAELLEAMHQSSAPYGPEVSEFEAAGLTAVAAEQDGEGSKSSLVRAYAYSFRATICSACRERRRTVRWRLRCPATLTAWSSRMNG